MICMCRVLKDLAGINADLAFWKRRLSEGSHGRFLLLSRGPSSFFRTLSAAVRRHAPQVEEEGSKQLSAADKIERRVRWKQPPLEPSGYQPCPCTESCLEWMTILDDKVALLSFCSVASWALVLLHVDNHPEDR